MLKEQKFGVEIEFTGITRAMAAHVVCNELGGELGGEGSAPYFTRTIKDSKGRKWKVMRDSSIEPERDGRAATGNAGDEYRVEFVTPPLEYEDIELLQRIVRRFREAGGTANNSCGIHIHVDGANHDSKSLRRLVNFMTARQDLIYEALGIQGRARSWCKKYSPELIKEMKKDHDITKDKMERIWYSPANSGYYGGIDHCHYNSTRYHGLNLHAFFTKGTIEFRLFNSTLHAGKIKAYIQFCLALSAWAIESDDNISFHSIENYTADQKLALMRRILIRRLGLRGPEFKTCRMHILAPLEAAAAASHQIAA